MTKAQKIELAETQAAIAAATEADPSRMSNEELLLDLIDSNKPHGMETKRRLCSVEAVMDEKADKYNGKAKAAIGVLKAVLKGTFDANKWQTIASDVFRTTTLESVLKDQAADLETLKDEYQAIAEKAFSYHAALIAASDSRLTWTGNVSGENHVQAVMTDLSCGQDRKSRTIERKQQTDAVRNELNI